MATKENLIFMKFPKRAETQQGSTLLKTFVDMGPLSTIISSNDHQVIYGRRGTGKTHALSYLAELKKNEGDAVAYVDLRNIGSSGGSYADTNIPIAQRSTNLLVDVMCSVHDSLRSYLLERAEEIDLSITGPLLDKLAYEITNVRVVGMIEGAVKVERRSEESKASSYGISTGFLSGTPTKLSASASSENESTKSESQEISRKESGHERHHIDFGAVSSLIKKILAMMHPKKFWVLLDEWSSHALDIQPYLADFLRRSLFGIQGVIVKIAAIEQRSSFKLHFPESNYIGIELGADASADLNLDDFMVFENDSKKAADFLETLILQR